MRPVLRRVLSVAGKLIGIRRPVIGGAIERIAEGKPVIQQKEPTPMKEMLKGKKTYLGIAFGCLVVVVNHFLGPIEGLNLNPANWMADLYALGLGGFMRAGINNAVRNG